MTRRVLSVLAAVALLAVACDGGRTPQPPAEDASDLRLDERPSGAWRDLPPAPIAGRSGHQMVWADDRLLVWGGFGEELRDDLGLALLDGALLDPASGEWEVIPDAPIQPDYNQVAVWSGEELLVWSNQGNSGEPTGTAAYHPGRGTWRDLPWAPVPRLFRGNAVWTGDELLVWGVDNGLSAASTGPVGAQELDEEAFGRHTPGDVPPGMGEINLAAYDPRTDRWREIAAPSLAEPRFGLAGVDGRRVGRVGREPRAALPRGPGMPSGVQRRRSAAR